MKYRHFGKDNQKKALLKGLALALFKNGGIETYRGRAKEAQKFVERLITLAKKNDLSARRRVSALMSAKRDLVTEIFVLAGQFDDRVSGFTRIIRLGKRVGDASEMVRLEWSKEIKKGTQSTKGTKNKKAKEEVKEEKQNATA